MKRPVVYISGPISSGNQAANLEEFCEAHLWLIENGFAPINPGLSMLMPGQADITHSEWLAADLPVVERCDVVVRLNGESRGADMEVAHAEKFGIPVFKFWEFQETFYTSNIDIKIRSVTDADSLLKAKYVRLCNRGYGEDVAFTFLGHYGEYDLADMAYAYACLFELAQGRIPVVSKPGVSSFRDTYERYLYAIQEMKLRDESLEPEDCLTRSGEDCQGEKACCKSACECESQRVLIERLQAEKEHLRMLLSLSIKTQQDAAPEGDLEAILAERQKVYGEPRENHRGIAQMWAPMLQPHASLIEAGVPLPEHVIALLMVLLKIDRMRLTFHADNYDDAANYLGFARQWQADDATE